MSPLQPTTWRVSAAGRIPARTAGTSSVAALPAARRDAIALVADTICAMPGAQPAWLAESGRYQDPSPGPAPT
ncbi:hypothetical protein SUDANB120_00007 [Streptomyces sp. enrichment culture]|uniref:hypothetical protein n=1 Tax=Streptomyces sp. enrichment culture TaxID=1795815 RepID=UPI003F557422